VTLTNVLVRSDVQGQITLPRAKVARITFVQAAASQEKSTADQKPPSVSQLAPSHATNNAIANVQKDLLSNATPEATRTYNELVRRLMTGSLNVSDLRKQAQQTMADAEEAQAELGPEAGAALEGYLQILRQFIDDAAPKGATNK
jgi:hypothetical protein